MANQIYSNIVLTEIDRAILSSYKRMCDGLSDYLGSGYEFVLHSLEVRQKEIYPHRISVAGSIAEYNLLVFHQQNIQHDRTALFLCSHGESAAVLPLYDVHLQGQPVLRPEHNGHRGNEGRVQRVRRLAGRADGVHQGKL